MPFALLQPLQVPGYEQVLLCRERAAGYVGIVAVHSTALGPAVGGTRVFPYASEELALSDVLRLARGMSYKNAVAGLPLGGGKAVIIADPWTMDREAVFSAHGRVVDQLGGAFITAEDVGTSSTDMEIMARATRHVAGRANGGMGDPSPFTALGVLRAAEAAAHACWGTHELRGKRVALQGLGAVGRHLARALSDAGAHLVVADVDPARTAAARQEWGADVVLPDAIYAVDADIFAPCAMGGILDDDTVPRLQVRAVVGAANNQLLEERHGDALTKRGILYVPDYVANAGGVLSGAVDILGWEPARAETAIRGIRETVQSLLESAARERMPPHRAADRLAVERIRAASR